MVAPRSVAVRSVPRSFDPVPGSCEAFDVDRRPTGFGPDEELMRALYRDHGRPLYAYVMRLVAGDRQLAEDVVQETLLRAWRNAARLDRNARSLRPWLVTVARRVVVDDHRGRLARPQEAGPDDLEQVPAPDDTERVLRLMTIADAMAELSEQHRAALVETYFKDRTANEAAAELGVPPGTVRSRVFYALRSLRIALEERGLTP
jgi:RNA polymerase sigma-70 factor (ECF subfamily)